MPRKTPASEIKMELIAALQKLQEKIPSMLELKEQERKLDHENDVLSQEVLKLIRQIKLEAAEPRISALAGVIEQLMVRQIETDLADDLPWQKERQQLFDFSNAAENCIGLARKL